MSQPPFLDLLDWDVPQAAVEEVIGAPMPSTGMLIKDYLTSKDL